MIPRHCCKKEGNGWPYPLAAERKTRPYSNLLGTRRRQKKEGRPKTWQDQFQEGMKEIGVSWHGAHRIASDRDRGNKLQQHVVYTGIYG